MSDFEYRSNGKLMISGEYFVLDGATSFAVPLKLGQSIEVNYTKSKTIYWRTFAQEAPDRRINFFEAHFDAKTFDVIKTSHYDRALLLKKILNTAKMLCDDTMDVSEGADIVSNVEFNMSWGLGSSSTLIVNIAEWFNINPYELLKWIMSGSGYDIACAQSNKPLLYSYIDKPNVKKIDFAPSFTDQMFFIYSGRKVNSQKHILNYLQNILAVPQKGKRISEISKALSITQNIQDFMKLCDEHNGILGSALKVKNAVIDGNRSFNGVVKPMGAWGGDFFLAISDDNEESVRRYFKDKGYGPIFRYKDMALC